jgi:hypothetical protein
MLCLQLKSILSIACDVFTSQELPEEERIQFSHTLKYMIDVITVLNGTESDDLDEILFSAMKLVVVKWKPSILSGNLTGSLTMSKPCEMCLHN